MGDHDSKGNRPGHLPNGEPLIGAPAPDLDKILEKLEQEEED